MRLLIVNTDYAEFLLSHYVRHPGLESEPYEHQQRARAESLFGVADFYSFNLRSLGHEAADLYVNNPWMQARWASENSPALAPKLQRPRVRTLYDKVLNRVGLGHRWSLSLAEWERAIFVEQVKRYRPDVLLNQAIETVSSDIIDSVRGYCGVVVAQTSALLPAGEDLSRYDLVISSLPNYVERFRSSGINAHLSRLAFEPRILQRVPSEGNRDGVVFVGSLLPVHEERVPWLLALAEAFEGLNIWGIGYDRSIPEAIRLRHKGEAWGEDMYRRLARAKIVVNKHEALAEGMANNMRLYEATGMGTLLVTDRQRNLADIFDPEEEVASFESVEECIDLVRHYLENESERVAMARRGQQRTLSEHTYRSRMEELVGLIAAHA